MLHANGGHHNHDGRVEIYRIVKFTLAVFAGVLIVKFALFDTVPIATDQMSPSLVGGDRVVVLRTPFLWPFSRLRPPARGTPVVTRHPLLPKNVVCLRVAGLPGDSVVIGKGIFRIIGGEASFGGSIPPASLLLPEFTPRDSMAGYRIPRPGDSLDLDSLSLRDFFFAAAMIKQEEPKKKISIKANLTVDGKNSNNVPMTNFALYKGTLDSVPERENYSWFFWDRLREYWVRVADGKTCQLQFRLYKGNDRITRYAVHKSFIFLLADDWRKGYDSRYFGPASAGSIKGRVVCVLWSVGPGGLLGALRTDRIMKIVK